MAEHDGGAAFPNITPDMLVDGGPGMSLLDYFATHAMPQVIAHIMTVRATMIKPGQFNFDEVGDTAYQVADAMLRARNAKSPAERQKQHLDTFGAKDDERSKRMTMTRSLDDWVFVDAAGDTWLLVPTGDEGCPLTIQLVQRAAP